MDGDHIGRSLRRLEDFRFLTGSGRYVEDFARSGQLHAVVVRSPHAHALIDGIDTAAARAMPGVRGVFTAADLDARRDRNAALHRAGRDRRADDRAAAPGAGARPGAACRRSGRVRRRRHAASRRATPPSKSRSRTVRCPPSSMRRRRSPPARRCCGTRRPAICPTASSAATETAVEAAFAAAAHSRRDRAGQQPSRRRADRAARRDRQLRRRRGRVRPAADRPGRPLDPQPARRARSSTCRPSASRCAPPMSAAGSGSRISSIPNGCWCCRRRAGSGGRSAGSPSAARIFSASAQGRDNRTRARLALDKDGRFLALDVDTVANLGAYLSTNGPGSSTNSPASAMGGVYDIPAVFMSVRGVFTNTVPIDAYRGAGKPEANYLTERLVDLAARRLGIDPIELRRRNVIRRFPYRSGLGSRDRLRPFRGQSRRHRRRMKRSAASPSGAQQAASRGRLRGLGIACFLETSRGTPGERAEIRFEPDGQVALVLGTQSNGQGHETSYPADRRRPARPAARRLPLCPGRYARGEKRQRAWRRPLDAHGRRGAASGGADGHRQGARPGRPPAAGRPGRR